MAYIYPAPGVANVETTLTLSIASNGSDTGYSLPGLQDITVNAANDVFTWTQLDERSKLQIATTATNSLSMNIVLDQTAFFGDSGATAGTAEYVGVWGLSSDKVLVDFELYLGDPSDDQDSSTGPATGKTISGSGYITGLAPTVSADSPVWVSPITITVTGDYTVA
jgi:hypothetical protein